jgi:hypothetical protein
MANQAKATTTQFTSKDTVLAIDRVQARISMEGKADYHFQGKH